MASLQELPDDELDKLFRSSAEEFEPPYNSEHWNSLRQRLDEDDRSQFLYRFIYWGLPLLLLLLTTLSLVVQPEEVRPTVQKVVTHPELASANGVTKTARPRATTHSAASSVSSESSPSGASPIETGSPSATEKANSETVTKNRLSEKPDEQLASARSEAEPQTGRGATTRPSKADESTGNTVESTSIPTKISARSIPKNRPEKPVSIRTKRSGATVLSLPATGKTVTKIPETRRTRMAGTGSQTDRSAGFGQSETSGSSNPTGFSKNRKTNPVSSLGTPTTLETANSEPSSVQADEAPVLRSETEPFGLRGNLSYIATRSPKKPTLPSLPELDLEPMLPPVGPKIVAPAIPVIGYPSLSVRFIMAPDLNFVGSSKKAATDFEIGLVGEYRFARRFTIQSGVLRSIKKYNAPGKSYTKPPHWYGPMYESVDAVCTVLDIPVNLRFDLLLNERRRWFVSAGLSSYIMQKENYEYNYPAGTTMPSQQQYLWWSGKTGFHEFSHLNLSVGYERNFRSDGPLRRFSWQVEPFLKSPRRSTLGYGKIRLTSAGVFFSLRYRL